MGCFGVLELNKEGVLVHELPIVDVVLLMSGLSDDRLRRQGYIVRGRRS